jgi:hypothetical protein
VTVTEEAARRDRQGQASCRSSNAIVSDAARRDQRLLPAVRAPNPPYNGRTPPPWSSGPGRLPFTQEITGSNPVGGIAEKPGKPRYSRLATSPSAMVYGVGYHSWVPNETVPEPGERWRSRRPARRNACRFMDREVPVSARDGGHGPRLSLVNMGTVRRPEDCCLRPKGEASPSRFGAVRLLFIRWKQRSEDGLLRCQLRCRCIVSKFRKAMRGRAMVLLGRGVRAGLA